MSRNDNHGMLMASSGGGGGGVAATKKPSASTRPLTNKTEQADADTPIPVVLTQRTLFKLIAGIVGPLLILASGGAYFFYATTNHISDRSIHLERQERAELQTKVGCSTNAKKIADDVNREVKLYHRAAIVQQKEEIQKIGTRLEDQQRIGLQKILREVKQGNKATRRAIRASP